MNIQTALQSKAPGAKGRYSFARVFPFLVLITNFVMYMIVVIAMAFEKTSWDKWQPVLMFSSLTLAPSIIPLVIQTVAQRGKHDE